MTKQEFAEKYGYNSMYNMGRAQVDVREQLLIDLDKVIEHTKSIPFQKCPICNGEGIVTSPGYTSSCYDTCSVCKGNKIILMGR